MSTGNTMPNIISLGFGDYTTLQEKLQSCEDERIGCTVFTGFAPETISHPWVVAYGPPVTIGEMLSPHAAVRGMVYVGWYDPDNETYTWETVRLFHSWDNAAVFGKEHGQKAIYNIVTGEKMWL